MGLGAGRNEILTSDKEKACVRNAQEAVRQGDSCPAALGMAPRTIFRSPPLPCSPGRLC